MAQDDESVSSRRSSARTAMAEDGAGVVSLDGARPRRLRRHSRDGRKRLTAGVCRRQLRTAMEQIRVILKVS